MTFRQKIRKAKKLIREYIEKYPKHTLASSFGKDSMVLLHIARQVKKDIPVFSVLADTEFPETIKFKDKVVKRWKLNYTEYHFKNDPSKGIEDCCRTPKVEKFKEALRDYDCWFSAIRRDEGITRVNFKEVEERDGLVKVNPILDFTEKDIWRYIALYRVPVNPLYKKGYRSLSCRLCSAKEEDENEPERAGRWKGASCHGGECGIHTQSLR